MAISSKHADLASFIRVIGHSQITIARDYVCPAHLCRRFDLPAGFEAIDIAILDCIVAQGLGATRFVLM